MDPAQTFEAQLLARNKAMHQATERGDSTIQKFYCDATVFMTGGSGFLGKQLIEKLLRATKVTKIFVLLRPKKGKPIHQRLNEIIEEPLYDLLREQQPSFANKIVPIAGDVADLRLGMNDEDWKTVTEEVNIIFHLAATTRFDEPLRVATMINVRGTREALILGKACKQLKSYVHVSTAYSHACLNRINTEVEEDFCQSPVDPKAMIRLVETLEDGRLNNITNSLIKNWPNTYSFAKAVAEEIVRTNSGDLPICIVRPAIVICTKREPNPGWIDMSALYGASGLFLGGGIGIVHVPYVDGKNCLGLIPVDYVNNAIIAAGCETAKRIDTGETKPKIYTLTTSTRNPCSWDKLQDTLMNVVRKNYQSPAAVWYSFVWQANNPVQFWIYSWILHFIPAYIIDGVCLLLGKERRFVKLYTKIYKMMCALSYFTLSNWHFTDDNTAALFDNLSTVDQQIFNFDVKNIDWQEYMIILCLGLRRYIVKDELKGTEYGIKKQFYFKIFTFIITPVYIYFLYKLLHFTFIIISLFVSLFR